MATPIIDNIVLPANRCLVLPDEGSETTGTMFRVSARGFRRLGISIPMPENPEDPQPATLLYTKILFLKEGATEVEVDGIEYLAMHHDNIVGMIPN